MRERLDLKDCKPGDIVQEDIYKEGIMIPYIVEGAVFTELIRGRLEDIGVETLLIFREDVVEVEDEDEDEENIEDIEKDIEDLLGETDILTKKEFIPIYQKHLDYFIELAHIESFKYNKKKITEIFNYYYNENYKDILNIFKYARTSKLKLKDGLVKHSFDSALYALYIGDIYELPEEKLYHLFLGVLLHDFGKLITTKKEIPYYQKGFLYFNKKIDEKEKDYLTPILYHKEYYNGRGKPKGLKGTQIPLLARITTIAESCEKLTRGKEYLNSIKKLKSGKYKKILDQTIVIKLVQSLDI